jgi:arylsulfatase
VHEGGVASPFIVSWPDKINDRGALRHTAGHLIDIVPTVIELAGNSLSEQRSPGAPPLPGKSLLPAFAADREVPREYLFFFHRDNRGLRSGEWKAVKTFNGNWELYQMTDDRTETHNLAQKYPERLNDMIQKWQESIEEFIKNSNEDE